MSSVSLEMHPLWAGVAAALRRSFSLAPSEMDERMVQLLAELTSIAESTGTADAERSSGSNKDEPAAEEGSPALEPLSVLVPKLLARLDRLERLIEETPTRDYRIGHNNPPEDIGLPPYTDEDSLVALQAIRTVRSELLAGEPDPHKLQKAQGQLRRVGIKVLMWFANKADLAIDEFIKKGVAIAVGAGTFLFLIKTADDIAQVAEVLASFM